jgi:FtsZ-interacting cell division protein ZipA
MIGQIIVTAIGIIALVIGLWTIKEMQQKHQPKQENN